MWTSVQLSGKPPQFFSFGAPHSCWAHDRIGLKTNTSDNTVAVLWTLNELSWGERPMHYMTHLWLLLGSLLVKPTIYIYNEIQSQFWLVVIELCELTFSRLHLRSWSSCGGFRLAFDRAGSYTCSFHHCLYTRTHTRPSPSDTRLSGDTLRVPPRTLLWGRIRLVISQHLIVRLLLLSSVISHLA